VNKQLKITLLAIFVIGILVLLYIFITFRQIGKNFVHDKIASPEYYQHIQNRISFAAKLRGEKFDSLLNSFLSQNPQYVRNDSIGTGNFNGDTCDCNCLPFKKLIYFPDSPQELYLVTYEYGNIEGGFIDIVYQYRDSSWTCRKSSQFDSTEKKRIEKRFENDIVRKLKL